MACQCEVCLRLRAMREAGTPEHVIDYLIDLEMDRDYYRALVRGEFPGALEILEKTVRRLKDEECRKVGV